MAVLVEMNDQILLPPKVSLSMKVSRELAIDFLLLWFWYIAELCGLGEPVPASSPLNIQNERGVNQSSRHAPP
jgi:hypothetical protein